MLAGAGLRFIPATQVYTRGLGSQQQECDGIALHQIPVLVIRLDC